MEREWGIYPIWGQQHAVGSSGSEQRAGVGRSRASVSEGTRRGGGF